MSGETANALPSTDYVIRLAASPAERQAAYRLRYELFVGELKDERYADHRARHCSDSWDHEHSPVVVAWTAADEAIGTLRLAMRRLGPYLGDDLYEWGELAQMIGLHEDALTSAAGIVSRGGVAKAFRRGRVMSSMLEELERILVSAGAGILVGAVEAKNLHSKRWAESRGFRKYCASRAPSRFQGDFFYKDLRSG